MTYSTPGDIVPVIPEKPSEKLSKKIKDYLGSIGESRWDSKSISNECRRLEKKLGITRIEPKQYKMLRKIAESLKLGEKINLEAAARWAGYPDWKVKRAETSIMRNIDNALFTELVGINRNEIQIELIKVMKQDENLAAKNKALEIAAKITGMTESDTKVQINVVNEGVGVAD